MSDAYTVTIAPEAVIEVSEIAIWWNANRPAAPRLFQTELDRTVLRLAERPEVGPKVRLRGRAGLRVCSRMWRIIRRSAPSILSTSF